MRRFRTAAWCGPSGELSVTRRVSCHPAAIGFWAESPPEAGALASALPSHMLLYDAAPSGRTLLSSACAARNLPWISGLCGALDPYGVGLLLRDFAGRHALDHALVEVLLAPRVVERRLQLGRLGLALAQEGLLLRELLAEAADLGVERLDRPLQLW